MESKGRSGSAKIAKGACRVTFERTETNDQIDGVNVIRDQVRLGYDMRERKERDLWKEVVAYNQRDRYKM